MTREEALNKAIGVLTYHQVNFCKSKEAVANMNEIIEALENIDQECVADKDINVLTTDCISREAVMHILDEVGGDFDSPREAVVPIDYIADMVSELPSVMAQPKTGRLILLDECSNSGYYCSECQKKVVKEGWSNTVKKIKYCPNCGANMSEIPTGAEGSDKE